MSRRRAKVEAGRRGRAMQQIGQGIVRFQEASYAFDDVAAEVLALHRQDLPVMTALLFAGPASTEALAKTLQRPRAAVSATLERLELAGYAQRRAGAAAPMALTAHATQWIERIWAPLREDGAQLLAGYTAPHLAILERFVEDAATLQEARTTRLRAWLALPASPARRSHLRGGLSPAAMQRVQVFVEANLGTSIQLADLAARAGLSPFHFARAFRTSAGVTPRVFVEQRRVERARGLLADSDRALVDIAVESGFGTQSRFTFVFKQHTGFTPAVYRRGRR